MEDDTDYSKKILDYDPYISDLMSLSFISKGHKKRSGVLAYPMGQHFEKLGTCPILLFSGIRLMGRLGELFRCLRGLRRKVGNRCDPS